MNCPDCDRETSTFPCVCGYGTAVTPLAAAHRSTYIEIPFGITKEEFGLVLYRVLELIGGIRGIDEQRHVAIYRRRGYQLQALVKRRRVLQQELSGLLPQIPGPDMDRVLAQYPWVVSA